MAKRGKSRAAKRRARRAALPPGVYDLKVAGVKDFGLGVNVTYDMIDDDRYSIMQSLQYNLAKSMRDRNEREIAAIFNEGCYRGPDAFSAAGALDWKTTRDIYEPAKNAVFTIYERCRRSCPSNCTATREEHKKYAHAENYAIHLVGEAPGKREVRYDTTFASSWKEPNYARGSFVSLLAPGLKQVYLDSLSGIAEQAKEEIHMKVRTTALPKVIKPLVARTKREKALVAQTTEKVSREAGQEGYEAGLRAGQQRERDRSEAFLLKIVAAFRGPRASSSASYDE